MLVIVNTGTGVKVRSVVGGIARWSDGAVTHAARAGLTRGAEKVVECREAVSGLGSRERIVGEAFDGAAWVVSRERFDPPPTEQGVAKKAQVDAERDRRRHPGSLDTGLGWAVDFRDATDEANIAGMVPEAMALDAQGVAEAVLVFRGADNVIRGLTPAEMVRVGQAVRRHVAAVYAASWAIKGAIDGAVAAGDGAALDAIAVDSHPAWAGAET